MSEPLHIMIGRENGAMRSFMFSTKRFLFILSLSFLTLFTLASVCFVTVGSSLHSRYLVDKVSTLKEELNETNNLNYNLEQEVHTLSRKSVEHLANLKLKNDLLISKIKLENTNQVAKLEMKNLKQQTSFKEEKERLLSTVVNKLNQRNELFDSVMSSIGIKLKNNKSKAVQKNSGGPFIALEDEKFDELIYKADLYLESLWTLPLGKPVPGSISSRYGSRKDPLNNKKAFHSGIDIRGKHGAKVKATAAGKVIYAGRNGSFGNFVKIDHGNGYTTSFGHLQKCSVQKGESIQRGQEIGRVGNSGRSTGSHLHYEIAKRGKSVNPYNFTRVQ